MPYDSTQMQRDYSAQLREDLNMQVLAALRSRGIVNVAAIAEQVRLGNLAENIALEDIEFLVMQVAQFYGAPMEFEDLTGLAMETRGSPTCDEIELSRSSDLHDEPLSESSVQLIQ